MQYEHAKLLLAATCRRLEASEPDEEAKIASIAFRAHAAAPDFGAMHAGTPYFQMLAVAQSMDATPEGCLLADAGDDLRWGTHIVLTPGEPSWRVHAIACDAEVLLSGSMSQSGIARGLDAVDSYMLMSPDRPANGRPYVLAGRAAADFCAAVGIRLDAAELSAWEIPQQRHRPPAQLRG